MFVFFEGGDIMSLSDVLYIPVFIHSGSYSGISGVQSSLRTGESRSALLYCQSEGKYVRKHKTRQTGRRQLQLQQ